MELLLRLIPPVPPVFRPQSHPDELHPPSEVILSTRRKDARTIIRNNSSTAIRRVEVRKHWFFSGEQSARRALHRNFRFCAGCLPDPATWKRLSRKSARRSMFAGYATDPRTVCFPQNARKSRLETTATSFIIRNVGGVRQRVVGKRGNGLSHG